MVNPWIYDFACYDLFSKPIGFLQIAARIKKAGCSFDFVDCMDRFSPALCSLEGSRKPVSGQSGCGVYYHEEVKKPLLFKSIPRQYKRYGIPPVLFKKILDDIHFPDVILVTSGMTYWYEGVFEAIGILKDKFPRSPVILGGIYATLCYEHALRNSGADHVFKGDENEDFFKLLFRLLNKDFSYINGYISPAYELYEGLRYVSIRTSTGCPFKCTYCGWYLLNSSFIQRPAKEVYLEIEHFHRALGVNNFAFYDDALFYDPKNHIEEILRGILRKQLKIKFYTPNGLHVRFLNRELAVLLKQTGFVQPRLGFEFSDKKRQRVTGGKVKDHELRRAINFLKEAGYSGDQIGIYLLMGLPEQSFEEVYDSICFAHEQNVRVYLEEYSPVPGTPDYEKSGLRKDADPLMHNNAAFPLYNIERYHEFQRLKAINHGFNETLG